MVNFKENHWALLDLQAEVLVDGYKFTATTDVPCHLFCRMTKVPPRKHVLPSARRGIYLQGDIRFCFVVYEDNEQEEAGDTLSHTWLKSNWPVCETRWFYFVGTQGGTPSVSETAIFKFHFWGGPPPEPERLAFARFFNVYGATTALGHLVALAQVFWADTASKISNVFLFTKNNDSYNVVISIRHVDDNDLPLLPDLDAIVINLSDGVLVGGSDAYPVYKHIAPLPVNISGGAHYAVVARELGYPPTFWLTFRTLGWNPIYPWDEGSKNYVVRYRRSIDGGNTWYPAGSPTGQWNFEVWGVPEA